MESVSEIRKYLESDYPEYLRLLKQLIAINTVYDNPRGIEDALRFCKDYFSTYLKNYRTYFDAAGNLICSPKKVDVTKNVLYFCAHIDTVPADGADWIPPFAPFAPFEDEREIVGRGASDCKAGVAYQLFLAKLIFEHFPKTSNIVFTISAREESGGMSATEIGSQIGNKLPSGPKTYLINLEYTTSVDPPATEVNYGERGSVAIEIIATLDIVRDFLLQDDNQWNPTVIQAIETLGSVKHEELTQQGGHAATTVRQNNILYRLLTEADPAQYVLEAGSERLVSAVPALIRKARAERPITHKVLFDLRTFKKMNELVEELKKYSFQYRVIKSLDFGYSVEKKLRADPIYSIMNEASASGIKVVFEPSQGTTDSGRIFAHCADTIRDSFLPLTVGPGSRSQRKRRPARLAHGVNETYDKKAGLKTIIFISEVAFRMGLLRV